MTEAELQEKLVEMGEWRPALALEPFELLSSHGPPGALDSVATYRLVDREYRPVRDAAGREWRPILVVGDDVMIAPSPAMFDRLLAEAGYFDRPQEFSDTLLLQLHRFALDFYDGYQVREHGFDRQPDLLVVTGQASLGAGHGLRQMEFETRAGRDRPTTFSVAEEADLMG